MNRAKKPLKRLYVDAPLENPTLRLDAEQAHYLGRVLRCREGEHIVVFNARGRERWATIESLARRHPVIVLGDSVEPVPESNARIILLQALVKSDAMDLIVQKATELGVDAVFAVRTDFSVVRLDDARRQSRVTHWRRIALSACEQSGRHRPPAFEIFDTLDAAIAALPAACDRVAFAVGADRTLARACNSGTGVCLAVGPEGGFSPDETEHLVRAGFTLSTLGPRTLRAETAAIAACAGVQLLEGDLG
jgi:16S rRNA (uracil1498-N3)-methyltransferase